jgi:hypothetical protein
MLLAVDDQAFNAPALNAQGHHDWWNKWRGFFNEGGVTPHQYGASTQEELKMIMSTRFAHHLRFLQDLPW